MAPPLPPLVGSLSAWWLLSAVEAFIQQHPACQEVLSDFIPKLRALTAEGVAGNDDVVGDGGVAPLGTSSEPGTLAQGATQLSGEGQRNLQMKDVSNHVLEALASLFTAPAHFEAVCTLFAPLLLDIVARAISQTVDVAHQPHWLEAHENLCLSLAKVQAIAPYTRKAVLNYFRQQHVTPFERFSRETVNGVPSSTLAVVAESTYVLLLCVPSLREMWSLQPYLQLLNSSSTAIRRYAVGVLRIVFHLSEQALASVERRFGIEPSSAKLEWDLASLRKKMQVAIVARSTATHCNQDSASHAAANEASTRANMSDGECAPGPSAPPPLDTTAMIESIALSPHVVNISGILFSRGDRRGADDLTAAVPFVETQSALTNMRSIAVALTLQIPILLTGVTGCGKTLLIERLAAQMGRHVGNGSLIKVQMGRDTDNKVLLGTYVCTEVPGKFRYTEGVLTQAVRKGLWLLIEDIDQAPMDVISTLLPLVESNSLFIPGRSETIHAHSDFQLFFTYRTSSHRDEGFFGTWSIIAKHLTKVSVKEPQDAELSVILSNLYPLISPSIRRAILSMYLRLREHAQAIRSRRRVTPRDLIKFCTRVSLCIRDSSAIQTSDMVREAVDCFCAMLPDHVPDKRSLIHTIASSLGLHATSETLKGYLPTLEESDLHLRIGRCTLRKTTHAADAKQLAITGHTFAYANTKVSLQLMERVAVCIRLKEPVLLVGETGTGKTTTVQNLARCLGKKLIVINMSQQSDIADLLGGFKPEDVRALVLPAFTQFLDLLAGSFSKESNSQFIGMLNRLFQQRNWKKLLKAMQMFVTTYVFRKSNKKATGKSRKAKSKGSKEEVGNPALLEVKDGQQSLLLPKTAPTTSEASTSTPPVVTPAQKRDVTDDEEEDPDPDPEPEPEPEPEHASPQAHIHNEAQKQPTHDKGSSARASLEKKKVLLANVEEWTTFQRLLKRVTNQVTQAESSFSFAFVEGSLVKAVKNGDWILLDEVNLASPETLQCLNSLLEHETGSLVLTERGDLKPVPRHPEFRLIACMNPATDVGKRDLSPGLRNRFTEIYVDECRDRDDLNKLVATYLPPGTGLQETKREHIVAIYMKACTLAETVLRDGSNMTPHFSLRTLCRALIHARGLLKTYGLDRAVYEGVSMSFLTQLNVSSYETMKTLADTLLPKQMKLPRDPSYKKRAYVSLGEFWLRRGPLEPCIDDDYIITPTITQQLMDVVRVLSTGRFPVLLQGPTSSGKTSMVGYLASYTGHKLVRINNHEHTDIQEYLGSYVSDENGRLSFKDGALVQAVRKGYWVVLDELNLAPTDVLEALNRLLDDNRELYIPETQETIKAHENFMIFATQNPPGSYGGRKVLSRAFRNRFVEIHFNEIPHDELETILCRRGGISATHAKKLVRIMKKLQQNRRSTNVFAGKDGFITLRDLFRWATRYRSSLLDEDRAQASALSSKLSYQGDNGEKDGDSGAKETSASMSLSPTSSMQPTKRAKLSMQASQQGGKGKPAAFFDNEQAFAIDGYMLLAERVRSDAEKATVREAIEAELKTTVDVSRVYNCDYSHLYHRVCAGQVQAKNNPAHPFYPFRNVVWTKGMKRLFAIVERCIEVKEPILLVGDTGCGKTTVCQMLATVLGHDLHVVNCHQGSETADFLGGLRPVRHHGEEEDITTTTMTAQAASRSDPRSEKMAGSERDPKKGLFEWCDGPLVHAMRTGDAILLDEISLADDSVLERLNSVLEPSRLLVLAEKGATEVEHIVAHQDFRIMATMNPGGDFGKKELSPALRNRFTEIWVPPVTDLEDLHMIVRHALGEHPVHDLGQFAEAIVDFPAWLQEEVRYTAAVSLRDHLAWASFVRKCCDTISVPAAFVHGGCLVYVDGLGVSSPCLHVAESRRKAIGKLLSYLSPADQEVVVANGLDDGTYVPTLSSRPLSQTGERQFQKDPETSTGPTNAGEVGESSSAFGMKPFFVPVVPGNSFNQPHFTLTAPTSAQNMFRVLRAMQVGKSILLEGSPGVGKTSLVVALAAATNTRVERINLSEQTDVADLFGSDLPVEGKVGQFSWRDGPLLRALRNGDWVILDELNLASQSVLEGLNACLDHRGEVFIPELNRNFRCSLSFRLFACQNPLKQGGGRKGLPKSFLNRFTRVHMSSLSDTDLIRILSSKYDTVPLSIVEAMIRFNSTVFDSRLRKTTQAQGTDTNLRDVFRWCDVMSRYNRLKADDEGKDPRACDPRPFIRLIYGGQAPSYMSHSRWVDHLCSHSQEVFDALLLGECGISTSSEKIFRVPSQLEVTATHVNIGRASLRREAGCFTIPEGGYASDELLKHYSLVPQQLSALEGVALGLDMGWMVNLVGSAASGKTTLVRILASLCGQSLLEFAMNSSIDTLELLGGYEQLDFQKHENEFMHQAKNLMNKAVALLLQIPRDDSSGAAASQKKIEAIYSAWAMLTKRNGFLAKESGADRAWNGDANNSDETSDSAVDMGDLMNFVKLIARHVHEVQSEVDKLDHAIQEYKHLKTKQAEGVFTWREGMLVTALKEGHWLLIDNVNFCSPAVLDRLNGLLEPNGVLTISERGVIDGEVPVISPHPNFRLILAMDPQHGPISPAMRNRGVQVLTTMSLPSQEALCALALCNGLMDTDVVTLLLHYLHHLTARGHNSSADADADGDADADVPAGPRLNVDATLFSHACKLIASLISQGDAPSTAVEAAIVSTFGARYTAEELARTLAVCHGVAQTNVSPKEKTRIPAALALSAYPVSAPGHIANAQLFRLEQLLGFFSAQLERVQAGCEHDEGAASCVDGTVLLANQELFLNAFGLCSKHIINLADEHMQMTLRAANRIELSAVVALFQGDIDSLCRALRAHAVKSTGDECAATPFDISRFVDLRLRAGLGEHGVVINNNPLLLVKSACLTLQVYRGLLTARERNVLASFDGLHQTKLPLMGQAYRRVNKARLRHHCVKYLFNLYEAAGDAFAAIIASLSAEEECANAFEAPEYQLLSAFATQLHIFFMAASGSGVTLILRESLSTKFGAISDLSGDSHQQNSDDLPDACYSCDRLEAIIALLRELERTWLKLETCNVAQASSDACHAFSSLLKNFFASASMARGSESERTGRELQGKQHIARATAPPLHLSLHSHRNQRCYALYTRLVAALKRLDPVTSVSTARTDRRYHFESLTDDHPSFLLTPRKLAALADAVATLPSIKYQDPTMLQALSRGFQESILTHEGDASTSSDASSGADRKHESLSSGNHELLRAFTKGSAEESSVVEMLEQFAEALLEALQSAETKAGSQSLSQRHKRFFQAELWPLQEYIASSNALAALLQVFQSLLASPTQDHASANAFDADSISPDEAASYASALVRSPIMNERANALLLTPASLSLFSEIKQLFWLIGSLPDAANSVPEEQRGGTEQVTPASENGNENKSGGGKKEEAIYGEELDGSHREPTVREQLLRRVGVHALLAVLGQLFHNTYDMLPSAVSLRSLQEDGDGSSRTTHRSDGCGPPSSSTCTLRASAPSHDPSDDSDGAEAARDPSGTVTGRRSLHARNVAQYKADQQKVPDVFESEGPANRSALGSGAHVMSLLVAQVAHATTMRHIPLDAREDKLSQLKKLQRVLRLAAPLPVARFEESDRLLKDRVEQLLLLRSSQPTAALHAVHYQEWIELGCDVLLRVKPSSPVDKVASQAMRLHWLDSFYNLLTARARAHEQYATAFSTSAKPQPASQARAWANDAVSEAAKAVRGAVYRPPSQRYIELFHLILNFYESSDDTRSLRHLAASVAGCFSRDTRAQLKQLSEVQSQLAMWRDTIFFFDNELSSSFDGYPDIVKPISCGLQMVLHGISLSMTKIAAEQKATALQRSIAASVGEMQHRLDAARSLQLLHADGMGLESNPSMQREALWSDAKAFLLHEAQSLSTLPRTLSSISSLLQLIAVSSAASSDERQGASTSALHAKPLASFSSLLGMKGGNVDHTAAGRLLLRSSVTAIRNRAIQVRELRTETRLLLPMASDCGEHGGSSKVPTTELGPDPAMADASPFPEWPAWQGAAQSDATLSAVLGAFQVLSDEWKEWMRAKAQREAEDAEMFKYAERTTEMDTDEMEQERELQRLFPTYFKEFSDIDNDYTQAVAAREGAASAYLVDGAEDSVDGMPLSEGANAQGSKNGLRPVIDEPLLREIVHSHRQLFDMGPLYSNEVDMLTSLVKSQRLEEDVETSRAIQDIHALQTTAVDAHDHMEMASLQHSLLHAIADKFDHLSSDIDYYSLPLSMVHVQAILDNYGATASKHEDDGEGKDEEEGDMKEEEEVGSPTPDDASSAAAPSVSRKVSRPRAVLHSQGHFVGTHSRQQLNDFYRDPQPDEASLVLPVLRALLLRVHQLLQDFPENSILMHLVTLATRILGFPLNSPIPKLLTGLDMILQASRDWEQNAHKGVSLQGVLDPVYSLIIRWRKLQLRFWPRLIPEVWQAFGDRAASRWFALYDTVSSLPQQLQVLVDSGLIKVGGHAERGSVRTVSLTRALATVQEANAHVESIIDTIAVFLGTVLVSQNADKQKARLEQQQRQQQDPCNVGEFLHRLDLVWSFVGQLRALADVSKAAMLQEDDSALAEEASSPKFAQGASLPELAARMKQKVNEEPSIAENSSRGGVPLQSRAPRDGASVMDVSVAALTHAYYTTLFSSLFNLCKYHAQFVPLAVRHIGARRRQLEKEMKNFVKLIGWKDTNYAAMREQADKTHRKLHQFVRDYKETLVEPVAVVFGTASTGLEFIESKLAISRVREPSAHAEPWVAQMNSESSSATKEERARIRIIEGAKWQRVFAHLSGVGNEALLELQELAGRVASGELVPRASQLLCKVILPSRRRSAIQAIDGVAVAVIERIQSLQKWDRDTVKQQMDQLQEERKKKEEKEEKKRKKHLKNIHLTDVGRAAERKEVVSSSDEEGGDKESPLQSTDGHESGEGSSSTQAKATKKRKHLTEKQQLELSKKAKQRMRNLGKSMKQGALADLLSTLKDLGFRAGGVHAVLKDLDAMMLVNPLPDVDILGIYRDTQDPSADSSDDEDAADDDDHQTAAQLGKEGEATGSAPPEMSAKEVKEAERQRRKAKRAKKLKEKLKRKRQRKREKARRAEAEALHVDQQRVQAHMTGPFLSLFVPRPRPAGNGNGHGDGDVAANGSNSNRTGHIGHLGHIGQQVSRCNEYYYRILLRLEALRPLVHDPHKDLPRDTLPKCIAYASHLVTTVGKQRNRFGAMLTTLRHFGRFAAQASDFLSSSAAPPPDMTSAPTSQKVVRSPFSGNSDAPTLVSLVPSKSLEQVLPLCEEVVIALQDLVARFGLLLESKAFPSPDSRAAVQGARRAMEDQAEKLSLLVKFSHAMLAGRACDSSFVGPMAGANGSGKLEGHIPEHYATAMTEEAREIVDRVRNCAVNLCSEASLPTWLEPSVDQVVSCAAEAAKAIGKAATLVRESVALALPAPEAVGRRCQGDRVQGEEDSSQVSAAKIVSSQLLFIKEMLVAFEDCVRAAKASQRKRHQQQQQRQQQENRGVHGDGDANADADSHDADVLEARHIFALEEEVWKVYKSLRLSEVSSAFAHLLSAVQCTQKQSDCEAIASIRAEIEGCLTWYKGLLEQYAALVGGIVTEYGSIHKATSKLAYVLVGLFKDLFLRGFCVPPELQDDDGAGEEGHEGQTLEGTGMGEGVGNKDVSNEIENEEQVQGTKNEEQQPPDERPIPEEEDGLDMENDFEGDMFDMDEGNDDQDKDEDEDNDDEDMAEEMGEVDSKDAETLDFGMWASDNEDDDEEDGNNGKDEDTERGGQQTGEMELGAKQDDDPRGKQDDNGPDSNAKDGADGTNQDDDDDDDAGAQGEEDGDPDEHTVNEDYDSDAELGDDDDAAGEEKGQQQEQEQEQAKDGKEDDGPTGSDDRPDDLDLPDDMNLDGGMDDGADGEGDENDAADDADGNDDGADDAGDDSNKGENGEDDAGDENREEQEGGDALKDDGHKYDDDPEKNDADVEAPSKEEEPAADEADEADKEEDPMEAQDEDERGNNDDDDDGSMEQSEGFDNAMDEGEDKQEDEKDEGEEGNKGSNESNDEPPPPKDGNDPQSENAETESAADNNASVITEESASLKGQTVETSENEEMQASQSNVDQMQQQSQVQQALDEESKPSTGQQDRSQSEQRDDAATAKYEQMQQTNPFRSLANTAKAWRDRLNMLEVDEANDDDGEDADVVAEDDPESMNVDAEKYQYVRDNEQADADVLGSATKEQLEQQRDEQGRGQDEDATQPPPSADKDMERDSDEANDFLPNDPSTAHEKGERKDQADGSGGDESKASGEDDDTKHDLFEDADSDMDARQDDLDLVPEHEQNKDEEGDESDTRANNSVSDDDEHRGSEGEEDDDDSNDDDDDDDDDDDVLSLEELDALRKELEEKLSRMDAHLCDDADADEDALALGDEQSVELWHDLEHLTGHLSQSLCEQLRLVLEASLAAKMKGDYRTGKRLNMRKIIPYIASQFRKDKIWLRRTKPSKREYQIMLAIDNSRSMALNHSRQMALESLCLISQALTKLEAGELGVLKFGESVECVHDAAVPFTAESGAACLQQFGFDDEKTNIATLLTGCDVVFEGLARQKHSQSQMAVSQLLFIISDSHNTFQQGEEEVEAALQRLKNRGVFVVFVMIDNPSAKNKSILNQKRLIFDSAGKPVLVEYMDRFADKNYVVLKDIEGLPTILSDALRQWFEMMANDRRND